MLPVILLSVLNSGAVFVLVVWLSEVYFYYLNLYIQYVLYTVLLERLGTL